MYFSTVLLLLLTSKFTYSMNTQPVPNAPHERTGSDEGAELLELGLRNGQEEGELFPFIHPYTEETTEFIEEMTRYFSTTITGKMKIGLFLLVRSKKDRRDGCDTTAGRLVDDTNCKTKCIGQNRTYIRFMNKNISSLLRASFSEQSNHRVKLNPIDSNTGSCIQKGRTFECSCKSNYQITTSMSLINLVLDSIEINNNFYEYEVTKSHYFSALLLILKFHPIAAPLFVAYLFKEYGLNSERTELNLSDLAGLNIERNSEDANNNGVPENVAGMIDNKGSLVEKEEEIFQIIIHQVSSANSCDLRNLANKYLNELEIFEVILINLAFGVAIFESGIATYFFTSH